MKRLLIILGTMLMGTTAFSQGATDALRFARFEYEGSARTLSMGNAFTALGGDIGALSINPAASAVYRSNEFALSLGYNTATMTTTASNNLLGGSYSGAYGQVTLPSVGAVCTMQTGAESGLMSFNFGFTVNRIANFNDVTVGACRCASSSMLGALAFSASGIEESVLAFSEDGSYNPYVQSTVPWSILNAYDAFGISPIEGTTDQYIGATENIDEEGTITVGGPIDQLFYARSRGGIHEFSMNVGGNFSDLFYLGLNLNFHSVDYYLDEYYSERPVDPSQFQEGLISYASEYFQRTTGAGVNLKVGAIATPLPGLRVGATFQTPTFYTLTDVWNRVAITRFDNGNSNRKETPDGAYEYNLVTPLRWSVGLAYTGGRGLVSVDYEGVHYGKTRLESLNGFEPAFQDENSIISQGFQQAGLLRVGGEYWLIDRFAARLGYNYYTSPGRLLELVDEGLKPVFTYPGRHFISCGLGVKLDNTGTTSIDIAYQRMLGVGDTFTAYGDYDTFVAPVFNGLHNADKLIISFAVKL